MTNLILGIISISSASLLFYFSFRFYKNQNPRLALAFVVLGGIVLRVFAACDNYLHEWDEKYHALVSKNVMEHPIKPTLYDEPVLDYDPNEWTANHVWLEKGPVPLLTMSGSIAMFGANTFSIRIPSIIIGGLGIVLIFFLGRFLFSDLVGLIAGFLYAINGMLLELVGGRISSDHVEHFFVFFITAGILYSVRFISQRASSWSAILIGLVTALAILSKWFPALIVIGVWGVGLLASKSFSILKILKYLTIACLVCALLVIPYFIFLQSNYPEEFSIVFKKFIFAYSDTVEGHAAPWYYYLNKTLVLFGEAIPIALVIFLIQRNRIEGWKRWMLFTLIVVPLGVFSFADTKRATYILIAAPAFFIITAWTIEYLSKIKFAGWKRVGQYVLIALLVGLPIRYSIERLKPFELRDTYPEHEREARSFSELSYDPKTTVIFNVDFAIQAMFYSDYTVYKKMPSKADLQLIGSKGMEAIVYENGDFRTISTSQQSP